MTPYVADPDCTVYHGDALHTLRQLPDRSVHMCATSPPFFGLRDYGVDGQIGMEDTPDEWCARLVDVFREVRRVLRDDGTLWVEVGDGYSHGGNGSRDPERWPKQSRSACGVRITHSKKKSGLKPKDLVGQHWLLAFALRADGWYLRSEIIWARPNPMPESVTDRPTKSHSTVFLLSKQPRYFFDPDAIRTEYVYDGRRATRVEGRDGSAQHRDGERWPHPSGANARTVWTIATQPTPFAHFATFPEELVRRMILAGTSEAGCCPECGAPWERETLASYGKPATGGMGSSPQQRGDSRRSPEGRSDTPRVRLSELTETLGWRPSCAHGLEPVPCTVLDCFAGSGTTSLVARKLGRHSVGIELSEEYAALAARRLQQLSLLAEGAAT